MRSFPGRWLAFAAVITTAVSGCALTPPAQVTAPPLGTASPTAPPAPNPDAAGPAEAATDPPVVVPTPSPGASAAVVDVQVTTWGVEDGWFDAAAVVRGVVADDGRCTLELERGSEKVRASGPAARSAASSDCAEGLRISVSNLSSGDWTMTIHYSAPGFAGTSERTRVAIP